MRDYVDAEILIWHLRGEHRAVVFLRTLAQDNDTDLWVGALQRAEIVFFMRPNEAVATLSLLSQFKTQSVDQPIVDLGGALYRKWNPSHGIDVNDAILSATAMTTGGKIYTLNAKNYPMPDVVAIRAWKA